jgi:hypothetical protein
MLKGKNLLIIAGVAAVGYYLWKKNQAAKVIAPATAATNFTGNLSVTEYQNAYGINVVPRDTDAAAKRAYAELAKRKKR